MVFVSIAKFVVMSGHKPFFSCVSWQEASAAKKIALP
jgi:hypothetical protein